MKQTTKYVGLDVHQATTVATVRTDRLDIENIARRRHRPRDPLGADDPQTIRVDRARPALDRAAAGAVHRSTAVA